MDEHGNYTITPWRRYKFVARPQSFYLSEAWVAYKKESRRGVKPALITRNNAIDIFVK